MAQRPKPEVREAILRASAAAFAEAGFERASLGNIVERAGTSIGNFYKYFSNKEQLFAEFIPPGLTSELARRFRAQVQALRGETDVFSLEAGHPYRRASDDLLRFSLAHREQILFLLLRARGTKHQRFASAIVRLLVDLALGHAREVYPSFAHTRSNRRTLTRIYRAFVATIAAILSEERSERAVRAAVALHVTYHLTGLQALFVAPQPAAFAKERSR